MRNLIINTFSTNFGNKNDHFDFNNRPKPRQTTKVKYLAKNPSFELCSGIKGHKSIQQGSTMSVALLLFGYGRRMSLFKRQ